MCRTEQKNALLSDKSLLFIDYLNFNVWLNFQLEPLVLMLLSLERQGGGGMGRVGLLKLLNLYLELWSFCNHLLCRWLRWLSHVHGRSYPKLGRFNEVMVTKKPRVLFCLSVTILDFTSDFLWKLIDWNFVIHLKKRLPSMRMLLYELTYIVFMWLCHI